MRTKAEMRKEFLSHVSGLPGREMQHSVILNVGREYIHFYPLYEGSKSGKIKISDYYKTGSLYAY